MYVYNEIDDTRVVYRRLYIKCISNLFDIQKYGCSIMRSYTSAVILMDVYIPNVKVCIKIIARVWTRLSPYFWTGSDWLVVLHITWRHIEEHQFDISQTFCQSSQNNCMEFTTEQRNCILVTSHSMRQICLYKWWISTKLPTTMFVGQYQVFMSSNQWMLAYRPIWWHIPLFVTVVYMPLCQAKQQYCCFLTIVR